MAAYWRTLRPFLAAYLILQMLLRATLLLRGLQETPITAPELINVFARGLWMDLATAGFILLPVGFILLFKMPLDRIGSLVLRFTFLFALIFGFVAEHVFWTEFSTRFNFIAVDYLVYTQEVIGNIVESYPLGPIIAGITAASLLLTRFMRPGEIHLALRMRAAGIGALVMLCLVSYLASDVAQADIKNNAMASEVAANGTYNLFHAFFNNEISYEKFYAQENATRVATAQKRLLSEDGVTFEKGSPLVRRISPPGPERHKNVIIVVMESMSAEYMGRFGNPEGLTPNLDRLASQGLSFEKNYATGTRTVRGLEAVTLSIPPTPGQSILRRPGNKNLFSLGFIFQDRGYDTKFIYGGHGYFDNMNAFFSGNGFDVVDRTGFENSEVRFANIWGVADDDLFARVIKEADQSYARRRPFMHVVMTTSNHRPYTYPDGRIDIPSKTGRKGGVKYADYSVGQLIASAKKSPWFKDTVFVFVADHTAGAGGRAELDGRKYHIPMIFYAPGFVMPRSYKKISSQIDLAPVLLGQLNFHYLTKFYGEDLMHDADEIPHAFISNYQKVALVRDNEVMVLAPRREISQLSWPEERPEERQNRKLIDDTIAYYQSASLWRETYGRIPTLLKDHNP